MYNTDSSHSSTVDYIRALDGYYVQPASYCLLVHQSTSGTVGSLTAVAKSSSGAVKGTQSPNLVCTTLLALFCVRYISSTNTINTTININKYYYVLLYYYCCTSIILVVQSNTECWCTVVLLILTINNTTVPQVSFSYLDNPTRYKVSALDC